MNNQTKIIRRAFKTLLITFFAEGEGFKPPTWMVVLRRVWDSVLDGTGRVFLAYYMVVFVVLIITDDIEV